MKTLRLVCDSTLFVEALVRSDGASARVLREGIESGRSRWVLSAAIEGDLRRALSDREVLERSGLDLAAVERLLGSLALLADWVGEEPGSGVTLADDPARPYLEAVRSAAPAVILTTDRQLLDRADEEGVDALTPGRYLELREALERNARMRPARSAVS